VAYEVKTYVVQKADRERNLGELLAVKLTFAAARPHRGSLAGEGPGPWMHCPHCETRVARLYKGLGGLLLPHTCWEADLRLRLG
jgi:hypothetical protein